MRWRGSRRSSKGRRRRHRWRVRLQLQRLPVRRVKQLERQQLQQEKPQQQRRPHHHRPRQNLLRHHLLHHHLRKRNNGRSRRVRRLVFKRQRRRGGNGRIGLGYGGGGGWSRQRWRPRGTNENDRPRVKGEAKAEGKDCKSRILQRDESDQERQTRTIPRQQANGRLWQQKEGDEERTTLVDRRRSSQELLAYACEKFSEGGPILCACVTTAMHCQPCVASSLARSLARSVQAIGISRACDVRQTIEHTLSEGDKEMRARTAFLSVGCR